MHTPTPHPTLLTTLLITLLLTTTTLALPRPANLHLQLQSIENLIILAPPQPHTHLISSPSPNPAPSSHSTDPPSCGTPGTLAHPYTSNPATTLSGIPTAPSCASHCLSTTACLSFSYNQINGSCSLFHAGLSAMDVQKRGGGAVFWWDRTCVERRGDAVGMWDEREGGAEAEVAVERQSTVLTSRIATGRAGSSRIMHDPLADAAIANAIADVISAPTTHDDEEQATHVAGETHIDGDKDEPPASLVVKSPSSLTAPKAWPYGVGAVPADDADARRAWTWEGRGQVKLGNRRARRGV